jgi:hypothetical protein
MSRAVMRQALEALERGDAADPITVGETMDALRAALMEPVAVQEPAAWLTEDGDRVVTQKTKSQMLRDGGAASSSMTPYCVPAFTTPPRREWQGLTPADFDRICDEHSTLQGAARAIEAALRSKNYD